MQHFWDVKQIETVHFQSQHKLLKCDYLEKQLVQLDCHKYKYDTCRKVTFELHNNTVRPT